MPRLSRSAAVIAFALSLAALIATVSPWAHAQTAAQESQCMALGWQRTLVNIAGLERRLLWKRPPGTWSKGAIIVLHGGGGDHFNWCVANANLIAAQVRFSELALAEGFAVFLLDSSDRVTDQQGRVCGKVWDDEVRERANLDLPFIEHVLRVTIPAARPAGSRPEIFMTGLSSGGYMTLRAATRFGDLVTAFAPTSSGDPYGWHRICDPSLSSRERVFGVGFDNETNKQITEPNACAAAMYAREKPWDSASPSSRPLFRIFHHENDGINDFSCAEKAMTQLRLHGYPEAPAFVLRGGQRSLANHLWRDDYNRPMLDFFTSALVANVMPFARPQALSGLWYDPSRSGDGFNVLISNVGAVVTFYGYDAAGVRLWLISDTYAGPWTPGVAVTLNVFRGNGGTFVQPQSGTNLWGTMSVRFDSCNSGEFALLGADGVKQSRVVRLAGVLAIGACDTALVAGDYSAFATPQRVTIRGYDDHAMEPFLTRDGRYLLFNNSNAPEVDTDLHYAERVDDFTFDYRGEIAGVNSDVLDGVPSMDREGNFYFVSLRSYVQTLAVLHRGRFTAGAVTGVERVPGIAGMRLGEVNFDAEISPDGATLYFVDGVLSGGPVPQAADLAIAHRSGDTFERAADSATLLAALNTPALEYAPSISSNGLELFFTRFQDGRSAIYRALRRRADVPFEAPQRVVVIEGLVEAPTLSPDERALYYHAFDGNRYAIFRVAR